MAASPTPSDIRAAREASGLNQASAAALVYLSGQSRWAEYESGARNMSPQVWALFRLRSGLVTIRGLAREGAPQRG